MFKSAAAFLALLSCAAAFRPMPGTARRSTAMMAVQDMPGVAGPFGFFDPLGLSNGKSDERIKYFREAELKHGRVSMLAALGFLFAEAGNGPFFGLDTPSVGAFQQTPLQNVFVAVLLLVGGIEFATSVPIFKTPAGGLWQLEDSFESQNGSWDIMGLLPKDEAGAKAMKTKELNNGRLAMIAILGMIGQELATGLSIL